MIVGPDLIVGPDPEAVRLLEARGVHVEAKPTSRPSPATATSTRSHRRGPSPHLLIDPGREMAGGFELLEHQADVGIRAWGDSLEEAFEQAAWGLVEVLGAHPAGAGEPRTVRGTGPDRGAVLVDFLNELVVLHETEAVAFGSVRIYRLTDTEVEAEVATAPLAGEPEGVVKAATYHQLRVGERAGGGGIVEVYLDV